MNVLVLLNKKKEEKDKHKELMISDFIKGMNKKFPFIDRDSDEEIFDNIKLLKLESYQLDILSRLLKLKD